MLKNLMKWVQKGEAADVVACQIEGVHEDVLVAFMDALAGHGLRTHAILHEKIVNQRGDFFATVPPKNGSVEYLAINDRGGWATLEHRMRATNSKLVHFNTFQRKGQAELAARLGKPTWGVVHNPKLFASFPECMDAARQGRIEAFVLAPHVAVALEKTVPDLKGHIHVHHAVGWAAPGDDAWSLPEGDAPLEIVIPGTVAYGGRSWELLLEHLEGLADPAPRPVRFVIVAGGPDRADFQNEIAKRGIEHLFDFEPLDPVTNRVPHENLLRRMQRCHAMMPMLPPGGAAFARIKITTALPACVGVARPTLLPQHLAELYRIPAIEVPKDRPYDLREADLSDASLTAAREAMVATRAQMEQENIDVIAPLLAKL